MCFTATAELKYDKIMWFLNEWLIYSLDWPATDNKIPFSFRFQMYNVCGVCLKNRLA